MPTVPANNLFTMSILHCFLVCAEPLYQEHLKLGQSDKRGKNESGNKKYAKNDYFLIQWVILMGHFPYFWDTLYQMNSILSLSDENYDISRRFHKNLFKIEFTIRVWSDPVKWRDIWQICILLLSTHMMKFYNL